jgi:Gas vesicle synthesis protein GvpL/GvpF
VAVHLYGVSTAGAAPPKNVRGRADAELRVVTDDELSVLVSDIDESVPAGRKDLLAHAHVLETWVEQHTVVPMRFGIMLEDDEAIRTRVLRADHTSLLEQVRRFAGLLQLTVQAFHHEEPALREVLRRRPDLLRLREEIARLPQAATQPQQIQLGEGVAQELELVQEEDARYIVNELAQHAVDVVLESARAEHQVLHAAFLVRRDARREFDEAVGALRSQIEHSIRLRYVGPQPPYSFLEPVHEEKATAWA